jgi:hypothetical protein
MKRLFESLPDGCDVSYKNLFEAKTNGSKFAREQCERLWRDFHSLADKQFTEEFPFQFEQRWFEMYLGATLRNVGLTVSPSPKGRGGPDFYVDHDGRRFCVEAITPTQGDADNPDRVLDPIYTDADVGAVAALVPTNQITMRLSRAFKTKADKYKGYRETGKIPQDAACIIAINSRDIPHAWADAQSYWFRALYGVGNQYVSFNPDGSAAVEGREYRELLQGAQRTGDKPGPVYEVAPLLSAKHEGIAGVLGSSFGAGFRGPLGDDFCLMPHASPTHPYAPGFIGRGTELTLRQNAATGNWDVETVDYGALEAQGPHTVVVEHGGRQHEAQWQVAGRMLSVRVAGRGYDEIAINRADEMPAYVVAIVKEILRSQERDAGA